MNDCYVLKFGGTSVQTIDRLQYVATIIRKVYQMHPVAIVVSAIAGVTDELARYTRKINPYGITKEHDVVLSSGEQVAVGLLAITLQNMGIPARSFLAWQLPILTDDVSSHALITHIDTTLLEACFRDRVVPIIAGFQGVDAHQRLTTLGRGGSDTTAAALAAVLKAKRCDIYTDVEGVYTADPRLVPNAHKLKSISYKEMFALASSGSKVLHARSVALAMRYDIPMCVVSSFIEAEGTLIMNDETLEMITPRGISHTQNDVKITLVSIPDHSGIAARLFQLLFDQRIHIDILTQNYDEQGYVDFSFSLSETDLERVLVTLEALEAEIKFRKLTIKRNLGKISVVGMGLENNIELVARVTRTLAVQNINILGISTSEMRISVLIDRGMLEKGLIAIHDDLFPDFDKRR